MAFTVVIVAGTIWQDSSVVDAGKLNQGDGGMAITVTGTLRDLDDVSATAPTAVGQVLYWNGTDWAPSAVPSPADGSVYLGGDGTFHSISAVTAPSISLFNYIHFY